MTWFLFFLLTERNTTHMIPGTRTVYWVAWFVYRTAIKLQKNESGNCSIWNKCLFKWIEYKILIKNGKCHVIYFAWYFVNSLGIKNGKQLMKRNTRIIVLKLEIKMSRCCIILNNLLRNWPVMMEASTCSLNPLN